MSGPKFEQDIFILNGYISLRSTGELQKCCLNGMIRLVILKIDSYKDHVIHFEISTVSRTTTAVVRILQSYDGWKHLIDLEYLADKLSS